MLIAAMCLLVVPLAAGIVPGRQPALQQHPTFRTGVRTVAIYATVSDAEGRLVPDLDRGAFRIIDDGRPAEITVFSNEAQPITVAILLDMSNSMIARVIRVRDSTDRLVDAMIAGDRARIGTFGSEVALSPLLTGDKGTLKRVLREELWPGGPTPLWRALLAGMTSLEAEAGRRVVLVLTDGNDADISSSPPTAKDVKRRAVSGEFMVYAIGMERPTGGAGGPATTSGVQTGMVPKSGAGGATSLGWMFPGGLSREMVDVVEETGGGHFELQSGADLGDTFVRVAEELRHQYLLGFSPASLDGKTHKLEVQVTRAGCKARARKSYVAEEER
jgi:Ca-activated chloride channel family protein